MQWYSYSKNSDFDKLRSVSTFFVPYVVRKTQTARVHPPHPPPPSPPLGGEGELRKVEVALQALHKRVRGFLCVFSSLREPLEPLARPQRAMLRGIDMLRGHATERFLLPFARLGGSKWRWSLRWVRVRVLLRGVRVRHCEPETN